MVRRTGIDMSCGAMNRETVETNVWTVSGLGRKKVEERNEDVIAGKALARGYLRPLARCRV